MKNSIMFVSGFPGVGKSYLAENKELYSDFVFYDSDSSKFPKEDFPKNYVDYLESFLEKDSSLTVVHFVSTHKEVLDELSRRNILPIIAYPHISLKEEYLKRYKERGSSEFFIDLISDNWDNWIRGLDERPNDKWILTSGKTLSDVFLEKIVQSRSA